MPNCVQAASHGHDETVRELLKYKADVNATNNENKTALDLATNDECKALLMKVPHFHNARHDQHCCIERS
jgi:hypothetical protein